MDYDPEHEEERPRPYRSLPEDQVDGAQAGFLLAHPNCGEAVEIWRGPWSLVCWCESCRDLRTYQLVDPDEADPDDFDPPPRRYPPRGPAEDF